MKISGTPTFERLLVGMLVAVFGSYLVEAGHWELRGPDRFGVDLSGVAFANGTFVAVGSAGTVATSRNGSDWKVGRLLAPDTLLGVACAEGDVIAVGQSPETGKGVVWVSRDLLGWSRVVSDAPGALTRAAFGAQRWVAVGGSGWMPDGGVIAVSTNLITWDYTNLTFPVGYLNDVIFVDGHFLRAAFSDISLSNNGSDWSDTGAANWSAPNLAVWPIGLAAKDNTVVNVGRWGTTQFSSDGGRTWSLTTNGIRAGFFEVSASDTLFLAVGDAGAIATSQDGHDWAFEASHVEEALLKDAVFGAGQWVAVGGGGTVVVSPDGHEWHTVSRPTPRLTDIAFGNGCFVAAGPQVMLRSAEGVEWDAVAGQAAEGVAFGKGVFVAVGTNILVSVDGLEWKQCMISPKWPLARVTFGDGRFVAVGGVDAMEWAESIAYGSSDGTNWFPLILNSPGRLDSLAFADGEFVASSSFYGTTIVIGDGTPPLGPSDVPWGGLAGGHAGLLSVEPSGYVWIGGRRSPEPIGSFLSGAAYADGHYLAFGGGFDGARHHLPALWVSESGAVWRDVSLPTDRVFRAAAVGHDRLVVVGDGIIIERSLDDNLIDSTNLTIGRAGPHVTLRWLGRRGHHYRLARSANLTTWEPVADATSGAPAAWSGAGEWLTWDTELEAAATLYRLQITAE